MPEAGILGPLVAAPDGALSLVEPIDLLTYQRDCSSVAPGRAGQVIRPTDAAQVADALRAANSAAVPVYVRGGGTMYAGGTNPHAGGVVLDLGGLDRILDIDTARGVVLLLRAMRT